VEALEATNPGAYAALWGLLVDLDLTRRIVAAPRPVDEPLRWLLRNPRALRTTRATDNLWLRLLDVPAALEARTFDAHGGLVFEIGQDAMCPENSGTWRLTADPAGAVCARTAEHPDITLDVQSLGLALPRGSLTRDARRSRPDHRTPGRGRRTHRATVHHRPPALQRHRLLSFPIPDHDDGRLCAAR